MYIIKNYREMQTFFRSGCMQGADTERCDALLKINLDENQRSDTMFGIGEVSVPSNVRA